MPWSIFNYRDNRARNVIKDWLNEAGKTLRGKADAKIRMLRQFGPECPRGMFADTPERHIKKLRILGNDNTRILLCSGPIDMLLEYTLLSAHPEKDRQLPKGAVRDAEDRRIQVAIDPINRREPHEFHD